MMTAQQAFYLEYLDQLYFCMKEGLENNRWLSRLYGIDFARSMLNWFWYSRLNYRDTYCQLRVEGKSIDESLQAVALPRKKLPKYVWGLDSAPYPFHHPWRKILSQFTGRILVYVNGIRNYHYLSPIISELTADAVILTDSPFSDTHKVSGNIAIVPFRISNIPYCSHSYNKPLREELPDFWAFANTLCLYMDILRPRAAVCIDGCQTKYQMMGEICRFHGIPSICIQQGWPAILHCGFKNMPYDYFLSWGEEFSNLLSIENPTVKFMTSGYLYSDIVSQDISGNKASVLFVLQDSVFISSDHVRKELVGMAVDIARLFPDIDVYIRDHPVRKHASAIDYSLITEPNVKKGDDLNLFELYSKSLAVVSQFSSCLIEGMVYGCIPIVYNPIENFKYAPDLESLGYGKICESSSSLIDCLKQLLSCTHRHKQINKLTENLFCSYGNEAIDSAVTVIRQIANGSCQIKKKY